MLGPYPKPFHSYCTAAFVNINIIRVLLSVLWFILAEFNQKKLSLITYTVIGHQRDNINYIQEDTQENEVTGVQMLTTGGGLGYSKAASSLCP